MKIVSNLKDVCEECPALVLNHVMNTCYHDGSVLNREVTLSCDNDKNCGYMIERRKMESAQCSASLAKAAQSSATMPESEVTTK